VTALTAGYDEALKTGFATVAINNLGTLTVLSSSVNVANIISTDGGSRIQVSTTGSSIDFTTANIQVTLNYYVSGSSYTNGYSNYSPVIDYTQLTTDAFKVGVNRIDYSVVTYTLPTGSTVTQETVNPITSILQTPAGFDYLADVNETTAVVSSTTVVTGINKTFGNATDLLKSITPIPTSYNMVTGVTIPTNTFEIPYFINQGDLLPIFGRSDTPLIFYITFRYK
jgi:hypothetical protein